MAIRQREGGFYYSMRPQVQSLDLLSSYVSRTDLQSEFLGVSKADGVDLATRIQQYTNMALTSGKASFGKDLRGPEEVARGP